MQFSNFTEFSFGLQELDFIHEAYNSVRCAQDLKKFDYVHIPTIDWKLTTKRILTAEWIDGYKISDIEQIKKDKFSLKEIDQKLFNIFSEQIFNTGFVHADPHSGNGNDCEEETIETAE